MPLQLPNDLEVLVQKRLASGAYANAEEVVRRALEAQDAEDGWTEEERGALDIKIERALEQVATGRTYGPEEARRKLAAMREAFLLEREGLETADRIVTELFKSFYRLADIPCSGHRRSDLTSRDGNVTWAAF